MTTNLNVRNFWCSSASQQDSVLAEVKWTEARDEWEAYLNARAAKCKRGCEKEDASQCFDWRLEHAQHITRRERKDGYCRCPCHEED
jgi:hypothetical protein